MEKEKKLTRREEVFCNEYMTCFNGSEAARRVGYARESAAKAAHKLLSKPQVMARVEELIRERAERLCLSADLVVMETIDLLQKCKAAVPVMEWDYAEHCMKETGEYTVDSKGATKCLELLAKFLGMDGKQPPNTADLPIFYKDDMPEGDGDG